MYFVLAGTYYQYHLWEQNYPHHAEDSIMVTPATMHGFKFVKGEDTFVKTGTWKRRSDLAEIRAILAPMGIDLNQELHIDKIYPGCWYTNGRHHYWLVRKILSTQEQAYEYVTRVICYWANQDQQIFRELGHTTVMGICPSEVPRRHLEAARKRYG